MSIAFVQAIQNSYSSASLVQKTFATTTNGAGNMLVVVLFWDDTTTATPTLSDTATPPNTYHQIGSTLRASGFGGSACIFAAYNIAAAAINTNTVSATFGSAVSFPAIYIGEYSGVALSSAGYGLQTKDGSSASPGTVSIAPTTAGDMLIGGIYVANDDVTGAASGCNQRAIDGPTDSELVDRATVSTSSVAIGGTFTSASETYMVIAAAFAQPGGASPSYDLEFGGSISDYPISGAPIAGSPPAGWLLDGDSVQFPAIPFPPPPYAFAASVAEELPKAPTALEDGYGPGIGPTVVAYAAPQVQLGTQGVEDIFAPLAVDEFAPSTAPYLLWTELPPVWRAPPGDEDVRGLTVDETSPTAWPWVLWTEIPPTVVQSIPEDFAGSFPVDEPWTSGAPFSLWLEPTPFPVPFAFGEDVRGLTVDEFGLLGSPATLWLEPTPTPLPFAFGEDIFLPLLVDEFAHGAHPYVQWLEPTPFPVPFAFGEDVRGLTVDEFSPSAWPFVLWTDPPVNPLPFAFQEDVVPAILVDEFALASWPFSLWTELPPVPVPFAFGEDIVKPLGVDEHAPPVAPYVLWTQLGTLVTPSVHEDNGPSATVATGLDDVGIAATWVLPVTWAPAVVTPEDFAGSLPLEEPAGASWAAPEWPVFWKAPPGDEDVYGLTVDEPAPAWVLWTELAPTPAPFAFGEDAAQPALAIDEFGLLGSPATLWLEPTPTPLPFTFGEDVFAPLRTDEFPIQGSPATLWLEPTPTPLPFTFGEDVFAPLLVDEFAHGAHPYVQWLEPTPVQPFAFGEDTWGVPDEGPPAFVWWAEPARAFTPPVPEEIFGALPLEEVAGALGAWLEPMPWPVPFAFGEDVRGLTVDETSVPFVLWLEPAPLYAVQPPDEFLNLLAGDEPSFPPWSPATGPTWATVPLDEEYPGSSPWEEASAPASWVVETVAAAPSISEDYASPRTPDEGQPGFVWWAPEAPPALSWPSTGEDVVTPLTVEESAGAAQWLAPDPWQPPGPFPEERTTYFVDEPASPAQWSTPDPVSLPTPGQEDYRVPTPTEDGGAAWVAFVETAFSFSSPSEDFAGSLPLEEPAGFVWLTPAPPAWVAWPSDEAFSGALPIDEPTGASWPFGLSTEAAPLVTQSRHEEWQGTVLRLDEYGPSAWPFLLRTEAPILVTPSVWEPWVPYGPLCLHLGDRPLLSLKLGDIPLLVFTPGDLPLLRLKTADASLLTITAADTPLLTANLGEEDC